MVTPVSGGDVRRVLEQLAPPALAESWDNVGWQLGNDDLDVHGVLVTVDVDAAVIVEALERGANLIVAHHPLFFRPFKQIDPASFHGSLIKSLLRHDMYVYAAHTNLDAVPQGVNGALAEELGLTPLYPLAPVQGAVEGCGWGVICECVPQTTSWFSERVRKRLGTPSPRVTPALNGREVHSRVGLLGGSGGGFVPDAHRAGCTLFITGEIKYHDAQDAARYGVTVIEADHYFSERPVLDVLRKRIAELGVPVYRSSVVTTPYA
jgi:dinuclear metal center YbgI/SA1388 family protein